MDNLTSTGLEKIKVKLNQGTISPLLDWAEGFMLDRRARGLANGTISFYRKKLTKFVSYLTDLEIHSVDDISPNHLRKFFIWLEQEGHNRGGVIAFYKAVRTFLKWYKDENDLNTTPIDKVQISTKQSEPLESVDIETIKRLLKVSDERDKAIILFLMDTGLRASELVNLTIDNVNQVTWVVKIVNGKGGKDRTVYIGRKTRQSLRRYLTVRPNSGFLFTDKHGEPLTYWGLRQIIRRRSKDANVDTLTLHSGGFLPSQCSGMGLISILYNY